MKNEKRFRSIIRFSAWLIIIASIIGIGAFLLINSIAPQPAWVDVDTFLSNYKPIQSIPPLSGFVLIAGFILFVSASYVFMEEKDKPFGIAAIVFATLGAIMTITNYMIQSCYIPNNLELNKDVISVLAMTNPKSLCWVFEMFGYAFISVGMWLVSPAYKNILVRNLMALNGIMCIAGAVITVFKLSWVLSGAGYV